MRVKRTGCRGCGVPKKYPRSGPLVLHEMGPQTPVGAVNKEGNRENRETLPLQPARRIMSSYVQKGLLIRSIERIPGPRRCQPLWKSFWESTIRPVEANAHGGEKRKGKHPVILAMRPWHRIGNHAGAGLHKEKMVGIVFSVNHSR